MSVYKSVEDKAQQLGISVRELCRRAGANYRTVSGWKRVSPENIETYKRLMDEGKDD